MTKQHPQRRRAMAEPVGFDVQLFSRAEDCLAQLPAHFPGVILSDVRMPGSAAWSCWPKCSNAMPTCR
jgi:two-component system C4-dicarboxylate transport response regulator DctD